MYMSWYKRFTSKVFLILEYKVTQAKNLTNAPDLTRLKIANVSVFESVPTGLGRVKLNRLLWIAINSDHYLVEY